MNGADEQRGRARRCIHCGTSEQAAAEGVECIPVFAGDHKFTPRPAPVAEEAEGACGRCGQPAKGYATIDGQRYCHEGPDRTCYMLASWSMSSGASTETITVLPSQMNPVGGGVNFAYEDQPVYVAPDFAESLNVRAVEDDAPAAGPVRVEDGRPDPFPSSFEMAGEEDLAFGLCSTTYLPATEETA